MSPSGSTYFIEGDTNMIMLLAVTPTPLDRRNHHIRMCVCPWRGARNVT